MTHVPELEADIPWDLLDAMLSGRSPIDNDHMYLTTIADAEEYLESYGYEYRRPEDLDRLEALRVEAIEFVEKQLLFDEPNLSILPMVREQTDVRRLLLWASDKQKSPRQLWSCSLLRVLHTFGYCSNYFKEVFDSQIREQILERFERHVVPTADGYRLGNGPGAVDLADFQLKGSKTRESLAMKLLHKADNVAADIFDWVGMRFVTRERFDCLLVTKYLRVHNVVNFAHVRPGRSRNTLVDIQAVKAEMERLDWEVRKGKLASYEKLQKIRECVRDFPYPASMSSENNLFSSVAYHSIQFTCSHPVRVRNPWVPMSERAMSMDRAGNAMLRRFLGGIGMQPDIQFRFPFEVQIMDQDSFELSRSGLAAHEVYKERQRSAVKRRLWASLVTAQDHEESLTGLDP